MNASGAVQLKHGFDRSHLGRRTDRGRAIPSCPTGHVDLRPIGFASHPDCRWGRVAMQSDVGHDRETRIVVRQASRLASNAPPTFTRRGTRNVAPFGCALRFPTLRPPSSAGELASSRPSDVPFDSQRSVCLHLPGNAHRRTLRMHLSILNVPSAFILRRTRNVAPFGCALRFPTLRPPSSAPAGGGVWVPQAVAGSDPLALTMLRACFALPEEKP